MARVTINAPEEVRDELQKLRDQFRIKTDYETIERLMKEYREFQEFRKRTEEEKANQRAKAESEMLVLGEARKKTYMALKKELGLGLDVSVLDFLLAHYENSPSIDKKTFDLFRHIN
ncbi:hypothetical protein [Paenibacillus agricola]|uniref:Uncharacterized protein n=1 Tax=Paenibacillus agricola TaxID=2716264 RepID=A0ABX0JIU9_9BACL|nr:hypothetical protein [Paenibacillus agricola]NHN35553.1 hypothetical protein [Paenibacillus agricola]